MTTVPARRKHSACLLRIRENCPFRKFKKNRCYDVTSTSAGAGVRWSNFCEHPVSASNDQLISGEPTPPIPTTYPVLYHNQQLQHPVAMDMEDIVRGPTPKMGVLRVTSSSGLDPRPLVPNLTPPNSESNIELSSGVDPETGERAQK